MFLILFIMILWDGLKKTVQCVIYMDGSFDTSQREITFIPDALNYQ